MLITASSVKKQLIPSWFICIALFTQLSEFRKLKNSNFDIRISNFGAIALTLVWSAIDLFKFFVNLLAKKLTFLNADSTVPEMAAERDKTKVSFEIILNYSFFMIYLLCTIFSFVVNGSSLESFLIAPFVGLFLFILLFPVFLPFFLPELCFSILYFFWRISSATSLMPDASVS